MESRTQGSRPRPKKFFEAKAKNRPSRGQRQGPRTQTQMFSKKKGLQNFFSGDLRKKGHQNFFSSEKDLQKIFFRRSLLEETKKKVFADFPQGFWRFPTKFQRFKNSAVLEPRTGQFSRTWDFEAKAKDFKMCSRGQGRPRGLHLWKLSWSGDEIANTNFRDDEKKNYGLANCQSQIKQNNNSNLSKHQCCKLQCQYLLSCNTYTICAMNIHNQTTTICRPIIPVDIEVEYFCDNIICHYPTSLYIFL